jgi:hypothetical protein
MFYIQHKGKIYMPLKPEISHVKEIKESQPQQSTSSWNVTKESSSRNTEISLPKTNSGEALQRAMDRYERGERGEEFANFSSQDAKILVEDIKAANITSQDIDQAVKEIFPKLPDTLDTERSKKLLLDLSTDMGNIDAKSLEKYKDIHQSVVNEKWEKIQKKLLDSPALQAALKYALEEKTYLDIDDQIKNLPREIIKHLQNAANTSNITILNDRLHSNKKVHEKLILNAQEMLLNCDNYPQGSKTRITLGRYNKDIVSNIPSMSDALKNLRECLKSVTNTHLTKAINAIDDHLKQSPQ